MDNLINLAYILVVAAILQGRFRKSYVSGIVLAAGLFVALPNHLLWETPGSFPDFSVQRVLLIIILLNWLKIKKTRGVTSVKFFGLMSALIFFSFLSTVFSPVFVVSLKEFLSLTIELVAFYFILMTSPLDENDYMRIMRSVSIGLVVVAIFGFTEKYLDFNPVDSFVGGYQRMPKTENDVISTYPHRILFGAAMAMGWPIVSMVSNQFRNSSRSIHRFLAVGVFLMLGALYFSNSRGPWAAGVLGFVVLLMIGKKEIKKKLIIFGMLTFMLLLTRPGVYDTLFRLTSATFEEGSHKAGSYHYRWELWQVAYSETMRTPLTFFLGYGPGASRALEWGRIRTYDGRYYPFESWDNQYACNLLEYGFFGFTIRLILYAAILFSIYSIWEKSKGEKKQTVGVILTVLLVYLFMLSNVYIFAPQLQYLFWIVTSMGLNSAEGFEVQQ